MKLKLLFFLLLAPLVVLGQDFEYNGVNYTVISESEKTCRTKTGTSSSPGNRITGELVLQEKVLFNEKEYTLTEIGEYSFAYNRTINGSLIIPNTVTIIKKSAFENCIGITGDLIIGDSVEEIGEWSFSSCSNLEGLKLGNSVKTIKSNAFKQCSGFKGCLDIGDSVEQIESNAFYMTSFTELKLGTSVERLGNAAFEYCKYLTGKLILPEKVRYVGERCFEECNFGEIIIKSTDPFMTVCDDAFAIRGGVRSVISYNPVPPDLFSKSFAPDIVKVPLYIPIEYIESYKKAFIWRDFINIIGFEGEEPIEMKCSPTNKIHVGETTYIDIISHCVDFDIVSEGLSYRIAPDWKYIKEGRTLIYDRERGTDISIEIIAEEVGEAIFTIELAGIKNSFDITVLEGNPEESELTITLNFENLILKQGETSKLTATIEPENATDKTVSWKSDNEAVATVSDDGMVTAISVGTAIITATCGSATATCTVTVNPVEATSIELSSRDVTLLIGSTTTLTATVYPENTTNQQITWSSSAPTIASVDAKGNITAIREGEATITATCGSASATCKVTVTPVAPTSIELNVKDMVLYIGQSETIQAIVRPPNTTYPTVTWHSDDESVATVSANGKVTGTKEGTATITATCANVSATCRVTVNPIPASNIEITSGNVTLTIGSSTKLAAKVSPDNTTHPDVDWSSSDTGVATIAADGTVTAVSLGTAIITAKCGNVSATCTVTVIPVPSEGIVISPSEVTMLLEETFTLSATVYPEDTTDKNVTWGSDNPSVASVSSTGVVTALSIGTARITARNGNSSATCQVTVNPVVATGISLNVKDETIFVASSTQLVATISPFNVTDKTITWTSSKPEIATVSDQGEVLGLSVGTTTVTASIGNVSASAQINVVHRIPDMDPAVTTSERDIVTISGRPVNMAVYAEGGEPTGWSYLWTKNGETVSKSSELNIMAINDTETVKAETYRVKVENEIDKVVILSEIFDFVVQIYPAIKENPDGNGSGIDISISTGTDSPDKTREGNIITLSASTPSGGNPQGWELIWSDAQGKIGEGESIETVATMSAGSSMAVEPTIYTLDMTNFSPEGEVWAQYNLNSNPISVYRRPQTPLQMLRKGDGRSHTFVTTMSIPDAELERLGYRFIFGWTDSDGKDHVIEQTNERYCHTDAKTYNDPANKFWVYSIWVYNDGCMVSSGLRYLDGSLDENFDASVFDGSYVYTGTGSRVRTGIYSIDGHYMGNDSEQLTTGIYIVISESHGVISTEKIIIP